MKARLRAVGDHILKGIQPGVDAQVESRESRDEGWDCKNLVRRDRPRVGAAAPSRPLPG